MFFFFNDTATTDIYTLSLHDALPILRVVERRAGGEPPEDGDAGAAARRVVEHGRAERRPRVVGDRDRKSTRLNSSHANISYAVFCLKKKKTVTRARQLTVIWSDGC